MSEFKIPVGFVLPLTPDAFAAALASGHGRALMHVKNHGADEMAQTILDACLKDRSYDPQLEGQRAPWLTEIIDAAGLEARILPVVVQKLYGGLHHRSFWDQTQLSQLALEYARRGNPSARTALYSALAPWGDSADLIAAEEIIALDGADGLLYIADRIGQWMAAGSVNHVFEYPLHFYDDMHGEGKGYCLLRSAALNNPHVMEYVEHLWRHVNSDEDDGLIRGTISAVTIGRYGYRPSKRPKPYESWSVDDVMANIEGRVAVEEKERGSYRGWGRKASDEELLRISERLFASSSVDRQKRYLWIFQARAMPRFDPRVLNLAMSPDSELRRLTHNVLSLSRHASIREFALRRIRSGIVTDGTLGILEKNYEEGDWDLIKRVLRPMQDRHVLHGMLLDLLKIVEANPFSELDEAMMLVYEHSPCSMCRYAAVAHLVDVGGLPAWIADECRYDSDEATRSVVSDSS